MNTYQDGDVLFLMTPDGGEMNIQDGLTEMTALWDSFVLIALMGSNREDDGTAATNKKQYMGNEDEEPQYQNRSRFHSMIYGKPITSETIKELGEAAALDINDALGGMSESVRASVSVLTNKRLSVNVFIRLVTGDEIRRRIELGL